MPFEGLNFGLARPQVPLESPMDAMGKMASLQGQLQQVRMGGMQEQQLTQQIQDASDLRNTLKTSTSLDDALMKAQKLGSPAAQGFIKNALEMKEKGVKLNAEQFDLANKHLAKVGQDLIGAANSPGITPQALAAAVQNHAQQGNIQPAQAQEMISQIPQNPADIPLWGRLQATKLGSTPDILKMFTPKTEIKDTGSALVSVNTNPLTGESTQGGVVAKKTITPGEMLSAQTARRGQDMGVGIYGGLPGAGPAAPRPAGQPGQPTGDPLAGIPDGIKPLVKAIGTYQMLPTQLGPRQKTAVMNLVAQAYPNYSIGDAEANLKFIKGLASTDASSSGGTIAASERLLGHVGELADLSDKLGNSPLGKVGNLMSYPAEKFMGKGYVQAFDLTKGKVIAELNKLANGGVPHAEEMKYDVEQLNVTDTPQQKMQVLKAAIQLGLEQTHAVESRRNNLLGPDAPQTSLLSPRAQSVVQRVFKSAGAGDPGLAAPTTAGYTNRAITNNSGQPPQQQTPKTVSLADVRATAQKYGKTVDQVMKDLKAKGIGVQ